MTNRRSQRKGGRGGFTLFEVLIALAIFALAVIGLATALNTALKVILEVRNSSRCRLELESRLAYCQANPPMRQPRITEADKNHGVRIEEVLVPYVAKDGKGNNVQGLQKLTITVKSGSQSDKAEVLLYLP